MFYDGKTKKMKHKSACLCAIKLPVTSDKCLFQQVAFIGRTSVGKSSLINALLNQKKLVRTSKKPVSKIPLDLYYIISFFQPQKVMYNYQLLLPVILLIFSIDFGTVF